MVNKAVSDELCGLALTPNLELSAKSISKEVPKKQSDANYCSYDTHVKLPSSYTG